MSVPTHAAVVGAATDPAPAVYAATASADPYEPERTDATAPTAQLQPAIGAALTARGGHRLVVALRPADLGTVELRVTRGPGGAVHVALAAERPETLYALRQDHTGMRDALERAGVQAHASTISFSVLPASGAGGGGGEQARDHAARSPPHSEPPQAEPRPGQAGSAGGGHAAPDPGGQRHADQPPSGSRRPAWANRPATPPAGLGAAAMPAGRQPARVRVGIDLTA